MTPSTPSIAALARMPTTPARGAVHRRTPPSPPRRATCSCRCSAGSRRRSHRHASTPASRASSPTTRPRWTRSPMADARSVAWPSVAPLLRPSLALRANDGADTTLQDFGFPQGGAPGEWIFTPGPAVRIRPRLGVRHAVRAGRRRTVPSWATGQARLAGVRRGSQRDQGARRRRHHHAERTHRRADRDRPVLVRELTAAVEPDRAHPVREPAARPVGERAPARTAQHGAGRRLHQLVRHQVPLPLLAPRHRDPRRRLGRQSAHERRSRPGRRC